MKRSTFLFIYATVLVLLNTFVLLLFGFTHEFTPDPYMSLLVAVICFLGYAGAAYAYYIIREERKAEKKHY